MRQPAAGVATLNLQALACRRGGCETQVEKEVYGVQALVAVMFLYFYCVAHIVNAGQMYGNHREL